MSKDSNNPVTNQVDIFDPVQTIPEDALQSIEEQISEAGGAWQEPGEYTGSIGRTMFDTPSSEDGTVTVLLPKESIDILPNQSLVRIQSLSDNRSYLGAVVKGPFAEPDGLRADAPILVSVTVKGGLLMPKYHGRIQVEIIGEEMDDGTLVPPRRRPHPNSPVFALSDSETAKVLQTGGEIRLGLAEGNEELEIRVPLKKSVFPRHVGVLGTTGGGKSTTVSGLVNQLQLSGAAVILLDTEGEYTAINEPTEDQKMLRGLKRREIEPQGVDSTYVYHLVGRATRNPSHPHISQFSLKFSELSPYAVMEILGLNEAQKDRFQKAYDITKLALEKVKIYPSNEAERSEILEIDEMDTGHPGMKLAHLYDIVKLIANNVAKDPDPYMETSQFLKGINELKELIKISSVPSHIGSWRAVLGRIGRVKRLGIFDNRDVRPINYDQLLKPGRVSIIDLSDTESPQINNLVIAEMLRGIQKQQDINYQEAIASNTSPKPAVIFIEEAHEFLTAQRIKDMPVLFNQVARIARRGRKRWLGLVFITQLPQHLPDEVLGLVNNWVLHKISDSGVVNRLKKSIGGIDDSLWKRLTALAPGQALTLFTSLSRPQLVSIDPTPCKLLMVD